MRNAFYLIAILASAPLTTGDRVYGPGAVSTSAAEIRLAVSPDGNHMLWGVIGRGDETDQLDIWERRFEDGRWSPPRRTVFSTAAVEFDPAFSPDGRTLYFHSDRPGGFGGTDIYVVTADPASGAFGDAENLGPSVNSAGDEWAPTPTPDGGLIFASDGWGGFGLHDLFEADLRPGAGGPRNLGPEVNGPLEDFDGALAPGGGELIFSSGLMSGEAPAVRLFRAVRAAGRWGGRQAVPTGCSNFLIGAAFDPGDPGVFYYAANCPDGQGRMDIRRTRLAH